jgi:hypothetical protein
MVVTFTVCRSAISPPCFSRSKSSTNEPAGSPWRPYSLPRSEKTSPFWRRHADPFTGETQVQELTVRFVLLTVVGETPKINGWTFAATIQHEEAGDLLRTCPGVEGLLPLRYRRADTQCEHCAKDRRRNDTYVLFHVESGEWKQVGRSCLADFLRTTSPNAMAEWAEVIASLDSDISAYEYDSSEGNARQTLYFGVQRLLAQVRCIVRQDGWCSRGEARASSSPKLASVDQALLWFDQHFVDDQTPAITAQYTATDDDTAVATALRRSDVLTSNI